MCGRFSQSERVDRIAEIFGADPDPALSDGGYNVAPTDPIRVVATIDGARRVIGASWGFKPFWRGRGGAREPGWINARSETADRSHRPPQPYAIGPATGGLLAFAGLWTDPGRDTPATATILTTGPNAPMRRLHHRMPVILDRADLDAWLAPDASIEEVMTLLLPAPDNALRIWPVSTAVNRVGNDGPELLVPIDGVPATLGLA
jgi:putative SOS response-associated peptidase YedK